MTIGWDKFSLKCINSPLSLLDGVGIDLDVETHNKVRPAPGNQVLILIKRFTFIRFSYNLFYVVPLLAGSTHILGEDNIFNLL